ncbi:MAG TPA: peptide ABC transporter substrate-binding protein [Woeseiaceae bacterium]|jgi:oligopeptide transport system substrate-binding protein|nr:peptide ABC transporter substrate-binding protein [Woeseiaceae bacterium]
MHRCRSVCARFALALLGAILLSAGCGGPERESAGVANVLNRSLGADPESLDPHKSRSMQAGDVQRDLGEGLTGYSEEGELEPCAAESWEISADGRTYTFHLRPEARWSNGEHVTAADFLYSLRRLVDPATAAFYSQSVIGIQNARDILAGEKPAAELGVSAPERLTLVIRLDNPIPYFLALLTHPSMFPVYEASVEHAAIHAHPEDFVSNGAYRLARWEVGSFIELERNEFYWDNGHTTVDRVRWHVTTEPRAELNRYRAGEIDITASVPSEAFAKLRKERPAELKVAPRLGVYYYGLNLSRPPFKDNRLLRQALSMAIDREVLAEIVGRGEKPAYSWVPPGVDNYDPPRFPFADLSPEERHAAARNAYSRAGYSREHPAKIEIRYNTSETHQRIALAVQSMWREVLGVETTLINEEFHVLLSNMQAMKVTEVFRSSWTGDYDDANTFLDVLTSDASSNMTGYASDEYDSMMRRAAQETDPTLRRLYMEEAERVLLADDPVIPLYFYVSKHLVSPRVQGWEDNVLDYHYSQHLGLAH